MTRGGVTEDPQYGMTTVDLNNLAYAEEPFVLANDVAHEIRKRIHHTMSQSAT